MYTDLKGKCALITGSGKMEGIGYAVARKLAASGVNIIISDVGFNQEGEPVITDEMQEISTGLSKEFNINSITCWLDVTDLKSINDMISRVTREFTSIDILVNNAGVALGVPSEVADFDEDAWLKTFDINLHGAFRVSKAVLPTMKQTGGTIINMSSRAGKVPPIWNGAYAVSKAGLIMLTKVMALELASSNIRVNAVCPGLVMTGFQNFRLEMEAQFFNSTIEERKKVLSERVPQNRMGTADEVASLVAYLASNESSYITGQALNVCGGLTMEL
ncbi:SDR family oxidoreductase [bacterium]|nr:SDR family oxidoreductase [bacterium]